MTPVRHDWLSRFAAAFIVLICLVISVGALVPEYLAYQTAMREHEEQTNNLARLFRQHADDTAAMAESMMLPLRSAIEAKGVAPVEVLAMVRMTRAAVGDASRRLSYRFADTDGLVVAASDLPLPLWTVAGSSMFRQHATSSGRGLVIGEPMHDPSVNGWVVPFSIRVDAEDGRFGGVLFATYEVRRLVDFYASTGSDHRLSVMMTRRDDALVLARHPQVEKPEATRLSDPAAFRASMIPGTSGHFYAQSPIDHLERLISYAVSDRTGLVLTVSLSVEDIADEWVFPMLQRGVAHLVILLIIAAMGLWGVRQIRRQDKLTAALAKREAELRVLAEGARDPILLLDSAGSICYASPASAEFFDRAVDGIVGSHIAQFVVPEEMSAVLIGLGNIDPRSAASDTIAFHFARRDGTRRWFTMVVKATPHAAGHGFVATLRDETEKRQHEQELTRLATTDVLTGIANRRRFEQVLRTEWDRAARARAARAADDRCRSVQALQRHLRSRERRSLSRADRQGNACGGRAHQ